MGLVDILDLEYNLILYILILYSITSMWCEGVWEILYKLLGGGVEKGRP